MQLFCRCFAFANLVFLFNMVLVAPVLSDDIFRVCADPKNPPYSDRNGGGFENKIAEMFALELGKAIEYTWFPQRMGFIRNTLKAKVEHGERYKCDYVMGVPAGYELTLTTKPYYHSTYALIYAKGRGWDEVKKPEDILNIDAGRKKNLRIAMFDKGPGTTWLVNNGLVENGVPYQTMTGDANINVALTVEKELKNRVIDMAILWGPVAGYLITHSEPGTYEIIPMKSKPGLKFDFPMAMGVRYGDSARKEELNKLIINNAKKIKSILQKYNVPLVDSQ